MRISNKIKRQQSKIRNIHGSPVITITSDVTPNAKGMHVKHHDNTQVSSNINRPCVNGKKCNTVYIQQS